MKVNAKNNKRMRRTAIIGVMFILFCFILEFNYPFFAGVLLYFISFIPVILVWYLIAILQFAGEEISVQTPFSIYLGVGFISLLSQLFTIPGNSLLTIGVLNGILIFYIIIAAFKIKNRNYSIIYRVYSLSLLFVIIIKTGIAYFIPFQINLNFPFLANIASVLDVIPLYIVFRIINITTGILDSEKIQTADTQQTA